MITNNLEALAAAARRLVTDGVDYRAPNGRPYAELVADHRAGGDDPRVLIIERIRHDAELAVRLAQTAPIDNAGAVEDLLIQILCTAAGAVEVNGAMATAEPMAAGKA